MQVAASLFVWCAGGASGADTSSNSRAAFGGGPTDMQGAGQSASLRCRSDASAMGDSLNAARAAFKRLTAARQYVV